MACSQQWERRFDLKEFVVGVRSKLRRDERTFLLQCDQITAGEEALKQVLKHRRGERTGGCKAFEEKIANGTNTLSPSENPVNHRKITRCLENTVCTSLCSKNAATWWCGDAAKRRKELRCGSSEVAILRFSWVWKAISSTAAILSTKI